MQVGAVLLLESARSHTGGNDISWADGVQNSPPSATPTVMLDVLGEPILYRIIESLHASGVGPILVLADRTLADHPHVRNMGRSRVQVIAVPDGGFQSALGTAFRICSDKGLQTVLVMRRPAYIEFDAEILAEHHQASGQQVTLLSHGDEPLEIAAVDCAGLGVDIATKFLTKGAVGGANQFSRIPYVNRLRSAQDIRRLAQDGLLGLCSIQPNGTQVRPSVWVGANARIHARATVAGPAYIGAGTRLRAGAHVGCNSAIERHCELDCGCAVEDTTVLPATYVGVGLKISGAVIDRGRLVDLARNIEVQVADSALLSSTSFPELPSANSFADPASSTVGRPESWLGRLKEFCLGKPAVVPAREGVRPAPEGWPMLEKLPGQADTGM